MLRYVARRIVAASMKAICHRRSGAHFGIYRPDTFRFED